jgi:hypothetical protein
MGLIPWARSSTPVCRSRPSAKGENARQSLAEIALHAAGEDFALSAVTLVELAHGVARANTPKGELRANSFRVNSWPRYRCIQ